LESLFFLPALFSQTIGSLKGWSPIPAGHALPEASGTLVRGRNNILGQATTGGDGRFQLPSVAPGRFEVKVEACGFRPLRRALPQ